MAIFAGNISGSSLTGSLNYASLIGVPTGIVSSSTQVDITQTTGYNTFSSSLATVDAGQTTRIDNLASLTSSYAINATIQSQLAGVASSSAQVKAYLPDGTVSSSGQVDYNSITNKLSGVVSSSAQVQPLLPAGTLSSSTQVNAILDADGVFSSSAQVVVQNTTGIGAIATTGSNTFTANQTITGSLFISQNLIVQGSSSISFISQSTLNIGTNKITMNTNTPGTRFGGIEVIDSGSSPLRSGSLYFDSINDQWIFVHQNTAGGVTSSVVIVGPQTFNNIGNETLLTQNRVLKSNGLEHVTDSQISDNGVTVSITNGLSVGTNVSASGANISGLTGNQAVFTDANDNLVSNAITGTGNVVMSASPTLTGTVTAANITANGTLLLQNIVSQSSAPTFTGLTSTGTVLLAGIYSSSGQVDYNSIQNKLSGVVSSSGQVQPLLPGGTVSSSAQYPGWVTASSQIDYNSIQNKLSGVISSSTQFNALSGTSASFATTAVTASYISGNIQFNNGLDITGSLLVVGAVSASSFTGSILSTNGVVSSSAQIDYNSIQNKLSGVVSSSTQVQPLLPGGTVSSSAQYSGWVTSSAQIVVQNTTGIGALATTGSNTFIGNQIITGSLVLSGSALPELRVVGESVITGSLSVQGTISGNLVLPTDTVSSSTQVKAFLPGGTVTSSAQYPGWVTASSQIDYNSITNKLSGVYSSSAFTSPSQGTLRLTLNGTALTDVDTGLQVGDTPLFTGLNTSGSINLASNGQIRILNTTENTLFGFYDGANILGAYYQMWGNNHASPSQRGTAEFVFDTRNSGGGFIIAGFDGSTWTRRFAVDRTGVTSVTGSLGVVGPISASSFTGSLLSPGVVSSSTQVVSSLPVGTVSSSAQYPGWVTSSTQVVWSSVNYNSGIVSSSTQVQPLLPAGTVSSSGQVDYNSITNKLSGVYSSSTQTVAAIASQTIAPTTVNATNILSGSVLQTGTNALIGGKLAVTGSTELTGTVTASNLTANQAVFTNASDGLVSNAITGTGNVVMSASPTLTGTITAANITATGTMLLAGIFSSSAQVDYNSIQNKLSGVVSSSAQVAPLLPAGTVSSSGQVTITATSGYSTFSSSIATKNDTQDISINALNAATSSYAINSTIQSQLAGVASSSAQVKAYLPGGTVSSSAQYPGWVTSSTQVLLNTVTGTTFSNNSFYFPLDLRVEGNLTAQQIYTEYVSSSVIYESGSSKFGDTTDDVMSVTGSILVLGGRISGSMTGMFSASSQVDYNSITNKLSGVVSSSAQVQPLLPGGTVSSSVQYPGWVTASSQIDYNSITNKLSGVYSSSTQAVAAIAAQTIAPATVNATSILSGSVLQTGTNALIGGKLAVTGAAEITGTVTASNLTANQAVFTNASDGLVSNAITGTGNVVMSASPTLTGTLTAANITANGTMLLQNIVSQSSAPSFTGLTSTGTVLLAGIYSSSAQTVAAIASQTIAPTTVNATSILSGSVLQTGTNALIGGKLAVTGSTELTGTVTASNLNASQAVFTNASDGLVSNAITGTGNVVMSASPTLTGTVTAANITANGTLLLQNIVSQSSSPSFTALTVTNAVSATAVTASGLTANQAVFTNASDGLVSNAITGTGNVVMSASPTLTGTLTAANITATGTMLLAGIISSSTASTTGQGNVRVTVNGANTDVSITNLDTSGRPLFSGSQFSGIVSGSGLSYRLVVPVGTNYYAT